MDWRIRAALERRYDGPIPFNAAYPADTIPEAKQMTETYFKMDHPCHRWVAESEVRSWYTDAVANNEANPDYTSIDDIMHELEDNGKVTFAWVAGLPGVAKGFYRKEER